MTDPTAYTAEESMVMFGRDDMVDVVMLDDYEEALERTAQLWGGDASNYYNAAVREDLWPMVSPLVRAGVLASQMQGQIALQRRFNDSPAAAEIDAWTDALREEDSDHRTERPTRPERTITLPRPIEVRESSALSGEATDEIMRDPELRRDLEEATADSDAGRVADTFDPWERRHRILIPRMEERLNAAVRLLEKAEKVLDTEGWEATGKAHAYRELASMHHKMATF